MTRITAQEQEEQEHEDTRVEPNDSNALATAPAVLPTVQRLESGFWHVHWSAQLWAQWPCHREPQASDFFQPEWSATPERIAEAIAVTDRLR